MNHVCRALRPAYLALWFAALFLALPASVSAEPKPDSYWNVEDVQPGMKGTGRTVMKGTKVETFSAEVLGVLKNISPGRDLILCRLSGLDLDKTGVIAGMSGSPVTIDGKLLGAVAYAWPFGKEPIAGITPFCQMHGYAAAFEHRDVVTEQAKPARLGLKTPLIIDGKPFDRVTVSEGHDDPQPTAADGLWLTPLRMPLAGSGFTDHSLKLLGERLHGTGLIPVQGGAVGGKIADDDKRVPLEAGGPLAVALILGDFDLSGIGTVTHIEGRRVYGWGHPFFAVGTCEFPLMTGYIHTIYPRQTVSFKMGSPLRTVGVINADISTCIAGWLDKKPDLMPLRMTVRREADDQSKTFNVKIVRQPALQAPLVYAALTNSVDMEGDLPEELTANLKVRIEVDGRPPVLIEDTFSGNAYSGNRAPQVLYAQVANTVAQLVYNGFEPVRIKRIDCDTVIRSGRCTAEIESVELDSDCYAPGETLRLTAFVRPYHGLPQRVPLRLKLPADLPEGSYTAMVCDDVANVRATLRDDPTLSYPIDLDHVFKALEVSTKGRRTNLVVRVPLTNTGVALDGKALPHLPPSMVQILANTRRTGAQTVGGALVVRKPTDWVIAGSESVRFDVVKHKKAGLRTEE
jgi:hypothetical protein